MIKITFSHITIIAICVVVLTGVFVVRKSTIQHPASTPVLSVSSSVLVQPSTQSLEGAAPHATRSPFIEPTADFRARVTKKPFGILVSPQDSPVQPERFAGYHTGADAEYEDIAGDVPVYAVASGTVVVARTVSGYGGVIAIQHELEDQPVIGIYGHMKPGSMPSLGTTVIAGQHIGILGTGYTAETDGERKHLHFALFKGATVNLLGYVQTQAELSQWIDPLLQE